MALISEWMVREGFLKEVTAEQAALGQSECPYLHLTACDETSANPPNQTSAGLHHISSFMGGERPAANSGLRILYDHGRHPEAMDYATPLGSKAPRWAMSSP